MFWNDVENEYANTIELLTCWNQLLFIKLYFLERTRKDLEFDFYQEQGKKKWYAYVSFLTAEMDPIPTLGCKKYQGNSQAMT